VGVDFIGRDQQLAWLDARLAEVRTRGEGRLLSVRGRRQVGKSRLVEEFIRRSGVRSVFCTATQGSADEELEGFRQAVASSPTQAAALAAAGPLGSWEAALAILAGEATADDPVLIVLDEFPYLVGSEPRIEATLQSAWRTLERRPLLICLVGSDVSMMQALNTYGRPLHGRLRELIVPPFSPAETADRLHLDAVDALDAQLVIGGMPRLASLWNGHAGLWPFVRSQLEDATSPLIVLGERAVNAEFPADLRSREVLAAIGAGERTFTRISRRSGIGQTQLTQTLRLLEEKLIARRLVPYSSSSQPSRNVRYVVADPYLRFWLRFLQPAISLVERGRGDVAYARIREGWATYRGHAIEPIVRDAVERLLPDHKFGDARFVGSYWTRDGSVEVDLVGGSQPEHADPIAFVGSVKWREDATFDRDDTSSLVAHRGKVPGATPDTRLVGVSRSGFATSDLDVTLSPADIITAWRS
jgi:AAA+ ATPase superfamily predicted ATPase